MIEGAVKDRQSVTPDWDMAQEWIEGVQMKEVKNVITRNGVTTEVFRTNWLPDQQRVEQIIHVSIHPGAITAWHCHEFQTDRIFVINGCLKLVLYDDRPSSQTRARINVLRLSLLRPSLVSIPPGVWHGIQNLSNVEGTFINFFDKVYCYEDPDEWRLPFDSPKIPYKF